MALPGDEDSDTAADDDDDDVEAADDVVDVDDAADAFAGEKSCAFSETMPLRVDDPDAILIDGRLGLSVSSVSSSPALPRPLPEPPGS